MIALARSIIRKEYPDITQVTRDVECFLLTVNRFYLSRRQYGDIFFVDHPRFLLHFFRISLLKKLNSK